MLFVVARQILAADPLAKKTTFKNYDICPMFEHPDQSSEF